MNRATLLIGLLALGFGGCKNKAALSEKAAAFALSKLHETVQMDLAQVREGLPQAAGALGPMLTADATSNIRELRDAVARARGKTRPLAVSKITFLAVTNEQGLALRSEADPDLLADRSVAKLFPGISQVAAGGPCIESSGEMEELRGVRTGIDRIWGMACPVAFASGQKGALVTGWSLRQYAKRLEAAGQREFASGDGEAPKAEPIFYAFVLYRGAAYGTPIAPEVNQKLIEDLSLAGQGPTQRMVEITGRTFALASRPVEGWPDATLVVLASEI